MIKLSIFMSLLFVSFILQAEVEKSSWVFFDLGDTVVSSARANHMHYFQGTKEYIEELKRQGFRVGLMTNIPETWGRNYDEKWQSLKKYINDNWDGEDVFDWSVFDEVILPLNNGERKPAPPMYARALSFSADCPSVFIGDSALEVEAAIHMGMAGKIFKQEDSEFYIPIDKIKSYLKDNYHQKYDPQCLAGLL